MSVLSNEQIEAFWRDGFLVVQDAVSPEQLEGLRSFCERVSEFR